MVMQPNTIPGKLFLRWLRFKMLHWNQFAFARNAEGDAIGWDNLDWKNKSKDAVSFDLEGALRLLPGAIQWEIQKRFAPHTKHQHLCIWNDQVVKSNKEIIDIIDIILKEFQ